MDESKGKSAAADAAAFELGQVLGERRAFGSVAGRCSAAEVACLRRIRDEKLYKTRCEDWGQFCTQYRAPARPTSTVISAISRNSARPFSSYRP